nr:mediator of RNA polymerase II transcription subunit 16-like isoform X1 [Danaus plexippus plexippus]
MELIYSMRRKPLKCEPPHFNSTDPEVVRPICTISIRNIIAFSSLTELSDTDGDTWGGHVYVCDIDTPWDAHKVTSTVHPVSALEWDGEGKQLLVATTVGDVSVFGQKDYLLNEWSCLYTANFPGEHIIQATFFHNGRRVVTVDKKPDVPIYERMQLLRSTPTLKGFGGVWCAGACVVSGSGLVGALTAGEGGRALVATDCMRPARDHLSSASITHKTGSMLIAACFRRGCKRAVRVARCTVSRPSSSKCAPVCIQLQPLPTVYLEDDVTSVSISWWLRDDTDALLIASHNLTLWKMVERSHPLHKLLAKGPVQGSTTPGGGPKTGDCFNTIVWQQAASWQLEGSSPATAVSAARHAAPALAVLVTSRAMHLLTRDSHHYLVSRPIITGGSSEVSSEATPPKKANYGGTVPVSTFSSSLSSKQLLELPRHLILSSTRLCLQSGAPCATVHSVAMSWLGAVCVALDTHSQIHVYRLQPQADMSSSQFVSQAVSQLEYGLVAGVDTRDVLLTVGGVSEGVYERLTENFQRQPASFQQYFYHTWLRLRIALCWLSPSSSCSAASLQSLQSALSVWAACVAGLRDDRGDSALLAALANDDLIADDKNLLALEAKADLSSEATSQALQPLQALRRLLQRALNIALTMLASLQPSNLHQLHTHNVYELYSDPVAVSVLRRLVCVSRACGRGGDPLSRPLARLASAHKPDLIEECMSVCLSWTAREWEGPPRCCVSAPHPRQLPLYLEYGVEPDMLRYVPEPPPHAQSDTSASQDMDSIRYMYLGGRGRAARWRQCGRCGARALPEPRAAPHALQRAYDGRYLAHCRCGGNWTLVSNV